MICSTCGCSDDFIAATCVVYSNGRGCSWARPELCSTCARLLDAGKTDFEIREINRAFAAFDPFGIFKLAGLTAFVVTPEQLIQETLERR